MLRCSFNNPAPSILDNHIITLQLIQPSFSMAPVVDPLLLPKNCQTSFIAMVQAGGTINVVGRMVSQRCC